MRKIFVRIANRDGKYTTPEKAAKYVARGFAREHLVSLRGQILEIVMLEAAELAVITTQIQRDRDAAQPGGWPWYVGTSGGSALMYALQGVSGGTRLWNARYGWPKQPQQEPQAATL